jgi:tRNA-Thr(GGU) m(6)t(6)A37 methyltransferase TsaA
MFTPQPIGFVKSQYVQTRDIPKGLGARHDAEGALEILTEFEQGLIDLEGFSHLFVLGVFDRADGFELLASPPSDNRTHGVFATRSPRRPNPIGLTVVELLRREGRVLHVRGGHARRHADSGCQALPVERAGQALRCGWLSDAEARAQEAR